MKEAIQRKDIDPYLWRKTAVSPCETHHLVDNKPIYDNRFVSVLKFHEPGYAPVKDHTGSYHIDLSGNPLYSCRFIRSFGFYEGYAAVGSEIGWFHILPNGNPAYEEKYAWCGNFQEGLCPVKDQDGNYFHIDFYGKRPYSQSYSYVGDFKDGIAVVCGEDGKGTHIDRQGNFVHSHCYPQLDIFHKGFARAKDEQGWFHVRKDGRPAYKNRFVNLEPFYNGQAHAVDSEGSFLIIDEEGQTIKKLYKSSKNVVGELSGDLVGFWKSETIKRAVELNLLDHLPGSLEDIAAIIQLPTPNLERVLRALWEIGIVEKKNNHWLLTDKGKQLVPKDKSYMAAASLMWSKVQEAWNGLEDKIKSEEIHHHPTFKEETTDESSLEIYRRTLKGYAQEDFNDIAAWSVWKEHSAIMGMGQTAITLLTNILKVHTDVNGVLLNEDRPIYHVEIEETIKPRLQQIFANIYKPFNIQADAVLLPRFLHYFPDKEASQILSNIHSLLPQVGKVYIFEMVLNPAHPNGSLLDLNMLAEAGGKLRTLPEWQELLKQEGFFMEDHQVLKPHLQLLIGSKS
jgi:DNA-binding MarR family transcriptional regulator